MWPVSAEQRLAVRRSTSAQLWEGGGGGGGGGGGRGGAHLVLEGCIGDEWMGYDVDVSGLCWAEAGCTQVNLYSAMGGGKGA